MAGAAAANNGGACAPGAGSPCGACKFLRRRCVPECVFAPYFSTDQGAARFAAIHKVFGASNASKLLSHLPVADRCEAVVTITYEAQARLRDPVYGCVAQIFALQQQVRYGTVAVIFLLGLLLSSICMCADQDAIGGITSRC
jgi:LOB domain-containing protein 16